MASLEGIPSLFPAQPRALSAKLLIYRTLFLWNQGIDQLVATLRSMEKFPFAHKSALQYAQAQIEEVRSEVNTDLMEELGHRELDDAGRFSKQRRAYESMREDPDDVYIDVQRREEERKKQGLPPRVGVVPYFAVAAEEERMEVKQEPTKQNRKRRSRPTAS